MSERLKQTEKPLWRKTMLQRLGIQDIQTDLYEISNAGDYYGYEGESMGEYYEEYRELFNELSMGAGDLCDAIARIEEYDGEDFAGWDDCTVALLGQTHQVLGFDPAETDYYGMMEFEQDLGVKEAQKRLERLTKKQLISLFRQVLTVLVCYMDIKAAYDTLNAIVCELDNRAAIMQSGTPSAAMWIE